MDIFSQIIAIADWVNFDRIRIAVLRAYEALQQEQTALNAFNYWEAHDNYMALAQAVAARCPL